MRSPPKRRRQAPPHSSPIVGEVLPFAPPRGVGETNDPNEATPHGQLAGLLSETAFLPGVDEVPPTAVIRGPRGRGASAPAATPTPAASSAASSVAPRASRGGLPLGPRGQLVG
eukprot:scaffold2774_cov137-Isochrysis_galbana.AAC.7